MTDFEGRPPRSLQLEGRVALVTGAARGIGLAISERLAAEGAGVALVDVDGRAVIQQSERLSREGHDVLGLNADITVPAQVERVAAAAIERWGAIDILVNNAGITGPALSLIHI